MSSYLQHLKAVLSRHRYVAGALVVVAVALGLALWLRQWFGWAVLAYEMNPTPDNALTLALVPMNAAMVFANALYLLATIIIALVALSSLRVSNEALKHAQAQRSDPVRPYLVVFDAGRYTRRSGDSEQAVGVPYEFWVEIRNVGVGPVLDLHGHVLSPERWPRYVPTLIPAVAPMQRSKVHASIAPAESDYW